MFWHSVYQQMRGDWAITERFAARATEAAVEQGFAMVVGVGQIMHGAAVAALGAEDPGLAEMKAGIEIYQSTSARAQLTLFLPLFADALMRQGRAEEAGVALDEAFALLPETDERFWVAEMHRSRAAILLASNRTADCQKSLLMAIDTARSQEARWYELRASRDLARLWAEQGERCRAADLLTPIAGWFTEGFDTFDMVETNKLLGELS
jgi:predicted ATPase